MSGRWTGTGAHRTRTIEWATGERYKSKSNGSCGRYVTTFAAKAECVCGWAQAAGDRPEAQGRARVHRAQLSMPAADLAALVATLCAHAIPGDLHAALRRVDAAAAGASGSAAVDVFVVDLEPLLRWANRPYIFAEHPYIPRLIAAVEANPTRRVGMLDSVRGYCTLLADSHGLTHAEWLRQVTTVVGQADAGRDDVPATTTEKETLNA